MREGGRGGGGGAGGARPESPWGVGGEGRCGRTRSLVTSWLKCGNARAAGLNNKGNMEGAKSITWAWSTGTKRLEIDEESLRRTGECVCLLRLRASPLRGSHSGSVRRREAATIAPRDGPLLSEMLPSGQLQPRRAGR